MSIRPRLCAPAVLAVWGRMNRMKVSLAQEYIFATNNIHSSTASSPNSGWSGLYSCPTSVDAVRFETVSLGLAMAIKCLTALLAAALLLTGVRAGEAVVRIVEDRGGRIDAYVEKYQGVRSTGQMVIIDGFCASACTIVLGTVAHDKICVTSRAKLGFHAAWDPGSKGRQISNPEATQTLYSMYPFEVRRWIDQRGGLTPHMIFLSGRQLEAMYRPCYRDSHASTHWGGAFAR
jgi:hypothetical protein